MMRRLGQRSYRAESPSEVSEQSFYSMTQSDVSLPSVDQSQEDALSFDTILDDERPEQEKRRIEKPMSYERIASRNEVARAEDEICSKLTLIVDLVVDFTNDAIRMVEKADDLLQELRNVDLRMSVRKVMTKVRVYLQFLDVEMKEVEQLLRFNVDRSTICDDRIDWLLHFTKCQKEMRCVLEGLSDDVCDNLEESLELRSRGMVGKRPNSNLVSKLASMQDEMRVAKQLLCASNRRRA